MKGKDTALEWIVKELYKLCITVFLFVYTCQTR